MRGASESAQKPTLLPRSVGDFFMRRLMEAAGFALVAVGGLLAAALVTFTPADPSFNTAADGPVHNFVGVGGAYAADLLLQSTGLAGGLLSLVLAVWGWRLVVHRELRSWWLRLTLLPVGLILATVAFAALSPPPAWPLNSGLGGVAGTLLLTQIVTLAGRAGLDFGAVIPALACAVLAGGALLLSLGLPWREWRAVLRGLLAIVGWVGRLWSGLGGPVPEEAGGPAPRRTPSAPDLVAPKAAGVTPGRRAEKARQATLDLMPGGAYELPPADLLDPPPAPTQAAAADREALAQNARLLESVLDDFGVCGKIIKVRPGPVVALYELEPAPGTKSSRVIGLSDDIARSMSAISVRVAVIPGRNVIGIELPNARRETVYLREQLTSKAYERTTAKLALALGKDISGAPVIVDLARMPHLLIAGTTGSGKSVALNAMILSLIYRLPPDECKFIMIDPKMLELSIYDGIPHLLAPVVTNSRKAVVALKWTVREMENRYRAMSQLGVRNITGYNARLTEARKKGEVLIRKVQTGFDPDTGLPVFEEQPLDLAPLPYIVVVVDEMADLMLIAGKEIEATVHRLSQMARAAGMHLIMATQRPSVDVITGTIKANFPIRISFQVTSKIDSRTILGEQGAEQLLGQGDLLYMAGGGRITRVHGPLVSDEEVEAVVAFLKSQGEPTYLEAVTEDEEAAVDIYGLDGGDELFEQAVALICRERKASTSFIQRHLQIGYNRAARIMERMEAEGIVSPANHVGRREVLAGTH